ncbi:hypothetical protein DSM112329_04070 [Paraconexibacter sp. AEG42_29]|uniref:DUF559 domain-containing protein n=1 Tax=Paraconexibacter sp. AEG42_29 TaxID=2997339 RepID=A0AAU7AZX6_9ACTN
MDHARIRHHASDQGGMFSRWQLRDDELTPGAMRWAIRGLRREFAGVYPSGWGSVTQLQRWCGATLTAPETSLNLASAAGFWDMRPDPGFFVTVVRPGTRGPNQSKGLLVSYSQTLAGNVVTVGALRVTTPERTLIDLWPHLAADERSRMLRETLRLKLTTPARLLAVLHAHRRRHGVAQLRSELLRIAGLPLGRCRSPAEAFGLAVLQEAGVELPVVNRRFAGEEADFTWPAHWQIVEIDGPQWHRFADEDARKTAAWVAAGFTVDRLPSPLLFEDPSSLLRLAPAPPTPTSTSTSTSTSTV